MIFKKAAGVVITCKDSAVLARRIKTYKGQEVPYGGYWAPFAGLVEEGEDVKDAAVRELKEETGLDANKEDLIFLDNLSSPNRFFTLYALEYDEFPPINLCEEHTDLGYFRIECLGDLPSDYKIDPEIIKVLQGYKKNIHKID